jgi:hypothetical protein
LADAADFCRTHQPGMGHQAKKWHGLTKVQTMLSTPLNFFEINFTIFGINIDLNVKGLIFPKD